MGLRCWKAGPAALQNKGKCGQLQTIGFRCYSASYCGIFAGVNTQFRISISTSYASSLQGLSRSSSQFSPTRILTLPSTLTPPFTRLDDPTNSDRDDATFDPSFTARSVG